MKNEIALTLSTLIETIIVNYEILKKSVKEAMIKARLVDNVVKAYAKNSKRLTNQQITSYQEFVSVRNQANENFNLLFNSKDNYFIGYMLKDNSNPDIMYEKVMNFNTKQNELISICEELIVKSDNILQAL